MGHNRLQHFLDPDPGFAEQRTAFSMSTPTPSSSCCSTSMGSAPRQIDLVDDRNDFQIILDGQVDVCERLSLHSCAASTTNRTPSHAARNGSPRR